MRPDTTYAKTDDGYVAYQVFGQGPPDILFITSWSTNLDVMWEEPSLARFFDRLASFSRVICFDKRGTGVSDPVTLASLPTLEEWMDDARVVLDAVGSQRAALFGDTEGGPMAILFAASFPERVSALILLNSFARMLRDEDYPAGLPAEVAPKLVDVYERDWGTGRFLDTVAPSVAGDPRFRQWFGRYQRLSMPPRASTTMYSWVLKLDVRSVLPSIRAPTLVLHRVGNLHHRIGHGRYLAEHIHGARLVELPGADSYPFHAGDIDQILDEVQEFLTGVREPRWQDRVLATVMFTDLVGSTDLAARLGDAKWLDLRQAHDLLVRQYIARQRGKEHSTTGDGFLATFDGPARAVRCAVEISEAIQGLGLEMRAGLHTGEVEFREDGIGGIAVHIAARVLAAASAGRVLVTSTVKDLVVGSGIEFTDRGIHHLKGVPGEWALHEVVRLP